MPPKYTFLPLTAVTIEDKFWSPRLRVNQERTIPLEYQQCKDTGRIDAFRLEWKPGMTPVPHVFWDSDVAKWIEAASYSLVSHPDSQLDALLDEVIDLIVSAQQPDGYLNTHFTAVEPEKRWTNLRDKHELYCAGHLIEAAVAHFQSTAKRSLLDVLCRYTDHIERTFGPQPGQKRGYPGHEELELALVKLYRLTGEQRYLDLSRYFIDERGRQPHYYDQEALARGEDPSRFWAKTYAYMQAHIPVRQQQEVVGHAVRAMYLYCALADLAAETGDSSLHETCERLWRDLCTQKMYLTGSIGPSGHNEGFTAAYDLPNESAYAETCAAIGLVFWNQRLLQLACEGRYADVMERALYNGVLSGVSLDGERFNYVNPLESLGDHHRQPWFDCACCPPNLARLLASLGNYIYAQNDQEIAVHLYIQGSGQFQIAGQTVLLRQVTRYPWEGQVKLSLEITQPASFSLLLRKPSWCGSMQIAINGEAVDWRAHWESGYVRLERVWQPSDQVQIEFDMPVERIYANPNVRQDLGYIALQRGPLVYCLEQVDNSAPLHHIILPSTSPFSTHFEPDLLGGVTVITSGAIAVNTISWEGCLYSSNMYSYEACDLKAIPYYAWDNRQPGRMRVWIPERNWLTVDLDAF